MLVFGLNSYRFTRLTRVTNKAVLYLGLDMSSVQVLLTLLPKSHESPSRSQGIQSEYGCCTVLQGFYQSGCFLALGGLNSLATRTHRVEGLKGFRIYGFNSGA